MSSNKVCCGQVFTRKLFSESLKINTTIVFVITFLYIIYNTGIVVNAYPRSSRKSNYDNPVWNTFYNNRRSDDEINSKFAGEGNQESEGRLFHRKRHRFGGQQFLLHSNPCRGRSVQDGEGRFFWDINVYNVYPNGQNNYNDQQQSNRPQNDCGGGGGGGGLFLDQIISGNRPLFGIPITRPVYRPSYRPINNRPVQSDSVNNNNQNNNNNNNNMGSSSSSSSSTSNNGNNNNNNNNNGGVNYDPVNDDRPVNEYIPNDSTSPQLFITPGQAVGGIANTVNSVIQTLTGTNRPNRRAQADQQYQDPVLSLGPGQVIGGLANTVNRVIQTLSGNGPNGQFLDSLYSGFNLF